MWCFSTNEMIEISISIIRGSVRVTFDCVTSHQTSHVLQGFAFCFCRLIRLSSSLSRTWLVIICWSLKWTARTILRILGVMIRWTRRRDSKIVRTVSSVFLSRYSRSFRFRIDGVVYLFRSLTGDCPTRARPSTRFGGKKPNRKSTFQYTTGFAVWQKSRFRFRRNLINYFAAR